MGVFYRKIFRIILLFLLVTTTNTEAKNKTKNDCTFNESSKITAKELLYCRYIRDDWNSNDISISELNFFYELQFKLEKYRQRIYYDNFYDVCKKFYNKSLINNFLTELQNESSKKLNLGSGAYKNLSVIESHTTLMPVRKNLLNDSELETGCKLFYVYENKKMLFVYFDIAYQDYTPKHIFTTSKLYDLFYRDLYKLILENPKFALWKDLLSNR